MTALACIRGCTRLRRHNTECPDTTGCPGCQPRLAEHGRLCYPCHRRLTQTLTDAPTVFDWLTVNLGPLTGNATRQDFERSGSSFGSPAPLKIGIYDIRQKLEDTLVEYVEELCEREKLTGPPTGDDIKTDAAYLLRFLNKVENYEWVGDWLEELSETMVEAHGLAPWRPEPRRCYGIPCPECEECALVIYGGDEDVTCMRCRATIPPERYLIWTQIAAQEWGAKT